MTPEYDDILDNLFNFCALAAYLDQAAEQRGWPDSEATKRRAYRYYEEALAEKNARKGTPPRRHSAIASSSAGSLSPSPSAPPAAFLRTGPAVTDQITGSPSRTNSPPGGSS